MPHFPTSCLHIHSIFVFFYVVLSRSASSIFYPCITNSRHTYTYMYSSALQHHVISIRLIEHLMRLMNKTLTASTDCKPVEPRTLKPTELKGNAVTSSDSGQRGRGRREYLHLNNFIYDLYCLKNRSCINPRTLHNYFIEEAQELRQ